MTGTHLKLLILILIALMTISLFNGLYVLFQDQGAPESRRTFHRLVIRACLATALLGTMVYGFYTGKLQSSAPWNHPEIHSPAKP
jgi:succinate dehydrogenase/fumarate reductase cytochrome b subunit